MGVKCVKCGSNNTAAYLYGLPIFDEALEKGLEEGSVVLGGCMVTDFDPKFYCNECQKPFGYSAMRLYDDCIVDYVEETTYYMFSINYAEFGETKFVLYKENDKCFVEFYTPTKKYSEEISEKEYKKNLTTIFEKALVLEWDEKYDRVKAVEINNWKVEIKTANGKNFSSSGKNYFPPYFKKAKMRHDYFSHKFRK